MTGPVRTVTYAVVDSLHSIELSNTDWDTYLKYSNSVYWMTRLTFTMNAYFVPGWPSSLARSVAI